ncbi:helix-turn-helix domain-containing protein [Undibacterium sp. MH2W]|uniref:helix-turn-helix domain-containing protein n=1 Tax=Undibacterium sp. MH2W TaxID=3413044 RepID=UPI003BF3D1C9
MKALEVTRNTQNNARLIDLIQMQAGVRTDSALSKLLDISPKTMSLIRTGKLQFSAHMILKIYDATGLSIEYIKSVLSGDVLADMREV